MGATSDAKRALDEVTGNGTPRRHRRARFTPLRDAYAGAHAEIFLIAGVSTVLIVRGYLKLTGYPQVGGGGLHIAHLLWGGLLMLAGLIVLLSYLGRHPKHAAAWLGGIGFGLFIDELGKFITEDNDYFFRPTIALIYVVFIALFLALRAVQGRRPLTPTEHLLNAISLLDQAAVKNLDDRTRRTLLRHLDAANQSEPLVPALRAVVATAPAGMSSGHTWFLTARSAARRLYRRLTAWRGFAPVVATLFVLQAGALVLGAVLALVLDPGGLVQDLEGLSFVELGALVSSLASGAFVVVGAMRLPVSRLAAFRSFDRALLISLLVGQPFAFAQNQLGALSGLVVTLLLLGAVRYIIKSAHEETTTDDRETTKRQLTS